MKAVLFLALFLATAAHAAGVRSVQVASLGGSVDVVEIEGGTVYGAPGESRTAFVKRAAGVLHAFTLQTGFEACSKLWTRGDQVAIRATTNRAHVGCVNTNLAPGEGWTMDADSLHSHPIATSYRTSEADALFQGYMVPVGTKAHTDGETFSPRDFGLGRGYLVNSAGRVLYQHGRGTVEDLGPADPAPAA